MKTKSRIFMASSAIFCALLGGTAMAASTTTGAPTAKVHYKKANEAQIRVQVKQLVNSDIIRLIIDNPDGRKIIVTLSDLSGSFINRVVSGKNEREVVRDFNFTTAEDGIYNLNIFDGQSTVKKEIHLKRIPQPDITQLSVL
jgi:hypothetical protein